jgi:hypothetical protein
MNDGETCSCMKEKGASGSYSCPRSPKHDPPPTCDSQQGAHNDADDSADADAGIKRGEGSHVQWWW